MEYKIKTNKKSYILKVIRISNINRNSLNLFLNDIKYKVLNVIKKLLKTNEQIKIQATLSLNVLRKNIFKLRKLKTKREFISEKSNFFIFYHRKIINHLQNQLTILENQSVHVKYIGVYNIEFYLFYLKSNKLKNNNCVKIKDLITSFEKLNLYNGKSNF